MSSEPVHIEGSDGDVWVARFTGPEGAPRIQLDVAGGQEHATVSLDLEDAAMVAGELLMARQQWLRQAHRARGTRAAGDTPIRGFGGASEGKRRSSAR